LRRRSILDVSFFVVHKSMNTNILLASQKEFDKFI